MSVCFVLFCFGLEVYGILLPGPRIELELLAVKVGSPNCWTTGEFPGGHSLKSWGLPWGSSG